MRNFFKKQNSLANAKFCMPRKSFVKNKLRNSFLVRVFAQHAYLPTGKLLCSARQPVQCFSKTAPATNFAIIIFIILIFTLLPIANVSAAINKQINYQGKLTTSAGVAVANGTYNMEFILYDDPTLGGAHILWTETRTTTDKVQVTSGLFSVLLGEVTALTGVDFNQTLYLVLPVSAILLILRIPVVRLIYGAGQFDWQATVLTGRTLGFFTLSIFAQALSYLAYRGFYALHDTKTPLIIGSITTGIMLLLSALFVLSWEPFFDKLAYNYQDSIRLIPTGVETIALAFSITSILNIALLMFFLNRRVGGIFNKELFFLPQLKILISAFAMGFALYIPIKLLDQLVFDTTRTINLLLLTGISSIAGFSLYLFLTWFFNVKEASTFLLLFRHLGNWREILGKSQSIIETKP